MSRSKKPLFPTKLEGFFIGLFSGFSWFVLGSFLGINTGFLFLICYQKKSPTDRETLGEGSQYNCSVLYIYEDAIYSIYIKSPNWSLLYSQFTSQPCIPVCSRFYSLRIRLRLILLTKRHSVKKKVILGVFLTGYRTKVLQGIQFRQIMKK